MIKNIYQDFLEFDENFPSKLDEFYSFLRIIEMLINHFDQSQNSWSDNFENQIFGDGINHQFYLSLNQKKLIDANFKFVKCKLNGF